MKHLIIFCTLLTVVFLPSCGNKKNDLVKTWQVSDIDTETDLADSIKTAMLSNSTFQFTEDGHYTSSGGIGADQGTYTLDEEGKTLSTISSAGRNSDVYTIEKLNDEKLVLDRNGTTISCTAITDVAKD